jgi:hypothetical protein
MPGYGYCDKFISGSADGTIRLSCGNANDHTVIIQNRYTTSADSNTQAEVLLQLQGQRLIYYVHNANTQVTKFGVPTHNEVINYCLHEFLAPLHEFIAHILMIALNIPKN